MNVKLKGMVQVYTGEGKGKTTAALGQGMRAVGRGLRVKMIQYLKSTDTGELHAVKLLSPHFEILRLEKVSGFVWNMSKAEKKQLQEEILANWIHIKQWTINPDFEVLILDEILTVVENGLLELEKLQDLLKYKAENLEIIITGRVLPPQLLDIVDLVTEMKEIKHYFHQGVAARIGIEY
ncbi:MAG: cob(I)yrinic acid a,c-diamide adenosyltransferase [Syntrophomonadaceae bacterium]|nr:cob(I)yrinic acid a,c-diamide adenosyltransferase [Syntrophomonadaceae bacterium]